VQRIIQAKQEKRIENRTITER